MREEYKYLKQGDQKRIAYAICGYPIDDKEFMKTREYTNVYQKIRDVKRGMVRDNTILKTLQNLNEKRRQQASDEASLILKEIK